MPRSREHGGGFVAPRLPRSGLAELLEDVDDVAGSAGGTGLGAVAQQRGADALGVMEELPRKHRLHLRRHRAAGRMGSAPQNPFPPARGFGERHPRRDSRGP